MYIHECTQLQFQNITNPSNIMGGLTHGQKFVIWMMIPVKNNWQICSTCVSKLESQMLITITNSNSSLEVNSGEVSLKLQCEICNVRENIHNDHLGGGAYVTFSLCTHVFKYELVPLENSHSKDELQSSLQWSFNYEFSLVCMVRSF